MDNQDQIQDTTSEAEVSSAYRLELPHPGDWDITVAKNGYSNTQTVSVTKGKKYQFTMSYGHRYGYRIKKSERDPYKRVEYLFDAVGKTPAHMDFIHGVFDYGDWGAEWFVTDNKPCMLNSDGTIDYYLNPNNYALKEDGTVSDVETGTYDRNAMSLIPLVWVKRYEDDEYWYEIISDIQYDDDYKAYAHTRADGSIADWFAWSIYGGSIDTTGRIRSLSKVSVTNSKDNSFDRIEGCKLNGKKWYIHTWSQHELIRTLLVLMGKSTDTQSVFGYGNFQAVSDSVPSLTTGTLDAMGQFYGYSDSSHQVKVFHIEKFWGDQWDTVAGVMMDDNGGLYVKMTPENGGYQVDDVTGYHNTGITISGTSSGYISSVSCSEHGIIPSIVSDNSSEYFCDGAWFSYEVAASSPSPLYLLTGACPYMEFNLGGAFAFNIITHYDRPVKTIGCGLSCEQPAVSA